MTTAAKEEEEKNADLKIILLGDSAVGKSKLVERFLLEDFVPRQLSTYALTLYRHETEIEDKKINVDFWDTVRFTHIYISVIISFTYISNTGWSGTIFSDASVVLLQGSRLYHGIRLFSKDHVHSLEQLVEGASGIL